ncbi:MAG: hypothetical protein AAGJ46_09525 [Planctomycetota bacterium]
MNFLNQFAKQITELVESMTPAARVTAGLLLAVVVVSIGFLFKQSTTGANEYLFGAEPLSSAEIDAMTAAISKAGLNDFDVEGSRIKVPRGKRHEYIAAVAAEEALPKHASDYMREAIENSNPFDSREQKLQRIKQAKQQQFSHIVEWYPWVQQASVIYDVRTTRGPRPTEMASATVSVLPKPGESLTNRRSRSIAKLVAGGFTSMSPEDVTISNMGGDDYAAFGVDDNAEEYETLFHRERARVENELRRDIHSHLSFIPGVRVQVNAILDETVQTTSYERKPDPQSVEESVDESESETTQHVADNVGRPGVTANGPRGPRAEDEPQRETDQSTKERKTVVKSRVGETETSTVTAGMIAKEIQASIEVPRDYVVAVWRETQALLTGDVPERMEEADMQRAVQDIETRVKNAVKPLLPKLQREDDYQQVNVVVIDTPKPAPLPEPSIVNEAFGWTTSNAGALGMAALAVFSLLMLRSMVKPTGDDDGGAAVLQLDGEGLLTKPASSADEEEEDEEGRPKLKLKKADSLKDDLSEIVRDDPEAAAAILRSWIANAG